MHSDELIIAEIRQNNETVLRDLYKKHYPMIRNLILFNSGSEPEAKDVYQETIIAFYEKVRVPQFVLTCQIKTYLYAVARRLWLRQLALKKRYVVKIVDTASSASVGDGQEGRSETFDAIDEEMTSIEEKDADFKSMETAMDGLGEPCRTLLEDFYINEVSMDGIREKFGYNNNDSAKNQKYKCLQRLKGLFFSQQNLKKI